MEMDIAKYVGLFLLKNEYCFLPGIGSLQVEKRSAVYDKEAQKMASPTYEVNFRATGGSIDDSFANFIANNERISIAHAANQLKDFCARSKAELLDGQEVHIPGIGKFVPDGNNVIRFDADPHLHIEGKAIPFFKNNVAAPMAPQEEKLSNIIERTTFKEPKADEEIEYQAPAINWPKIIILGVVLLALIGGGIYAYWYFANRNTAPETNEPVQSGQEAVPTTDTVQTATAAAPVANSDTQATAAPPVTNAGGIVKYNVAIQHYDNKEKAEARAAKLRSYGNTGVSVTAKDSANYYVTVSIEGNVADTAAVVDSLRRLFNPSGKVGILP
ncbi:MAG: hypothetical protein QM642_00465 [Edaphocola sp.]